MSGHVGPEYAPFLRARSIKGMVDGTVDASAWGTHDERERGTLEIGRFADFVVLSENLLESDPTLISEVEVLQTVMRGKTTYAAQPGRQDQRGT